MTRPKANLAVLSPKELKALESMRSIFANEPYPDQEDPNSWFQLEDWTYLRYLRARNFDLTKTEKMLRDTLEMRRTYSPHKLSADEPAMRAILNLGMWRLLPYNKLEEPVALTEVGAFDHSKLDSEEDFFRYLVLTSELACRLLMENGWKAELMM
ncbi:hypothetical protein BASA81_010760 [Batrachochytrium salamandrivorans]|nr:hypothetical protein BASA81_010760 [Batrachochytrium salamandrivorans]